MNDQYGDEVPDDLVVLDVQPDRLTKKQIKAVDDLTWYVPSSVKHPGYEDLILVSCVVLGNSIGPSDLYYTDPKDAGLPVIRAVNKIDRPLHRWSDKKFYNA